MTKKYQYFIALTEQTDQFRKNINATIILDHEITADDIKKIEADSSNLRLFKSRYIVTFYQLLKVTGTFTYRVLCESTRINPPKPMPSSRESRIFELDHQITIATHEDDYEYFENILKKEDEEYFYEILMHQEIPEA